MKKLALIVFMVLLTACGTNSGNVTQKADTASLTVDETPFYAVYNDCTAFSFITVESLDMRSSAERKFRENYVDFYVIKKTEHEIYWILTANALNPFLRQFDDIEYLLDEFVYDEDCIRTCELGGTAHIAEDGEWGTFYWFDMEFTPENRLQYLNWLFHGNEIVIEEGCDLIEDNPIYFGSCGNRANLEFIFE